MVKSKKKITKEEREKKREMQKERRKENAFKTKVRRMLNMAGFSFINTEDYHFQIGKRTIEMDAVFYFDNIIVICEYTSMNKKHIKDHLRGKAEAFQQIQDNPEEFIKKIAQKYEEHKDSLKQYEPNRILFKYLYFLQNSMEFSHEDIVRFEPIRIIQPMHLDYFHKMSQCIKKSFKYEMLRYLEIDDGDIGAGTTESEQKKINATIISPRESTGLKNGVRIVSFMMSAETLIKNAYVLRKDNWEESILLYQRLVQKEKIKSIREFLATREEAFFNNIIVTLPDSVYFLDSEDKPISIDQIGSYGVCSMIIPDKMNSICVIDGQHRIYAHYEGEATDKNEPKIAELRKKLHLLVTGLVFPEGMSTIEKRKIESEIFLDINTNAKPVSPDVLLHIKRIKDPLSDIGLARAVIEKLNKEQIFFNRFEMSSLDAGKIKIASIIKFALRYLVSIDEKQERKGLYFYWNGDKEKLKKMDDDAYNDYLDYCTKELRDYFCAIRKAFINDWNNSDSKILSVISLNGFIIAYNRMLDAIGPQDYEFFEKRLQKLSIGFCKSGFRYTSSQYKMFSNEIVEVLIEETGSGDFDKDRIKRLNS